MEGWAFVGIAVVVVAIIFVVWYFSADQRTRRAIKAVPISNVSQAHDGTAVRLVGQAEVTQPATAPLTGRHCAYWQVRVQQRRRSGNNNSTWVTIIDDHGGTNFVVRDHTGAADVDTANARAVLDKDRNRSSGFLNDASPDLEAFLNSHGKSSTGWVFNKTLRYHEGIIEPGERITVVGHCRHTGNAPAYRGVATSADCTLGLAAFDDGSPLLLSDEQKLLS
jgi:hypothetical protein